MFLHFNPSALDGIPTNLLMANTIRKWRIVHCTSAPVDWLLSVVWVEEKEKKEEMKTKMWCRIKKGRTVLSIYFIPYYHGNKSSIQFQFCVVRDVFWKFNIFGKIYRMLYFLLNIELIFEASTRWPVRRRPRHERHPQFEFNVASMYTIHPVAMKPTVRANCT